MRKNYLAKLVKYIKNVFDIEKGLNNLTDGRKNPTFKTKIVVLPVLFAFILRTRSFNELNNCIVENEFKNLLPRGCKLPKIDAIRDTLKVIDVSKIRVILKDTVRKARENKVFTNGTIDGYVVAAIDGTQTYNSDKKSCDKCLKASKKGKKEQRNFHSSVVLSTIGDRARLVLDFEPYRAGVDKAEKDEGELTTAKRLIERTTTDHKGLIDVIVYDAIGCNSEWLNACDEVEVDAIVRVKCNNINSVKEIKKQVNKSEPVLMWKDDASYESVTVYEGFFRMQKGEKELRFVKFRMKSHDKKYTQIMIVTTCIDMKLDTIFRIIRGRQDIENSIFNYLKKECGLEHCYVHGGDAIEAVLCLKFIAANLVRLFYYRRIRKSVVTQVELVRLLKKGLYLIKRGPEYMFSTA